MYEVAAAVHMITDNIMMSAMGIDLFFSHQSIVLISRNSFDCGRTIVVLEV